MSQDRYQAEVMDERRKMDDETGAESEHITGYCEECGAQCTSVTHDFGIGLYEYWGQRCRDVNKQEVSPCCEADVIDALEYESQQAALPPHKRHGYAEQMAELRDYLFDAEREDKLN